MNCAVRSAASRAEDLAEHEEDAAVNCAVRSAASRAVDLAEHEEAADANGTMPSATSSFCGDRSNSDDMRRKEDNSPKVHESLTRTGVAIFSGLSGTSGSERSSDSLASASCLCPRCKSLVNAETGDITGSSSSASLGDHGIWPYRAAFKKCSKRSSDQGKDWSRVM